MSRVDLGGRLGRGKALRPFLETVLSLPHLVALFSSLSAFIILGPRVLSMARDGCFESLAKVRPRPGRFPPGRSRSRMIAMIIVLSGSFSRSRSYMGLPRPCSIFAVLGVFKLRRGDVVARMPGYPGGWPASISSPGRPVSSSASSGEPRAVGGGPPDHRSRFPAFLFFPEKGKIPSRIEPLETEFTASPTQPRSSAACSASVVPRPPPTSRARRAVAGFLGRASGTNGGTRTSQQPTGDHAETHHPHRSCAPQHSVGPRRATPDIDGLGYDGGKTSPSSGRSPGAEKALKSFKAAS